jgi:nucleoside-diphosphate-sugar epimerase
MSLPPDPAGAGLKYQASKILAHQATHDFLKEHKPAFTLATLHPTFVLGRSLLQRQARDIDGINAWLWSSLHSKTALFASLCVHVRDVAESYLRILEKDVPSGTGFLLSGPKFGWEDAVRFVKETYPQVDVCLTGPFIEPPVTDTKRAEEELGMRWSGMEEIVGDVVQQQLEFRTGTVSSI